MKSLKIHLKTIYLEQTIKIHFLIENIDIIIVTTILTAIATGGVGAGIAAASSVGVAANFVIDLNRAINDADYYFDRIR